MHYFCQWILIVVWLGTGSVSFAEADDYAGCADRHCVAIVDAGSTGTRIHLFAYDVDEHSIPIHIDDLYSNKIKSALADIKVDTDAVDQYFSKLMVNFPKVDIPVYVYATAGLRLLSLEDQQAIFTEVKRWFLLHPAWTLVDARTISGTEEGLYGWLALNYYLNTLDNSTKPTAGLLEIGGASAQIVFAVQQTMGIDPHDLIDIDMYGRHWALFAHSFLGLGVNEIFKQSQNRAACFPTGYPLENGGVAKGDARRCQAEISDMLNQNYGVDALTQQPILQNTAADWYTVSAISMMASQAPFEFPASEFTAAALLKQADSQLCQQEYQPLSEQYPNNVYALRNCLVASYFYGLLVHGYGFSPNQEIHYLRSYDSDWTIGVVLHEVRSF